ncbi:MAG: hypothetical protein EOM64_08245 [Erysipelotrichia bacterium]|nr:hypothetical protein [Erysipelotrichia bacterium]
MTKYSRVSKYEGLRNQLQNDSESDIKSRDLSGYEKRLNSIDSNNFQKPDEYQAQDHDPIHARRRRYTDNSSIESESPQFEVNSGKNDDRIAPQLNENDTNIFNDSYLNDYINEVKQYNIDQGNAITANTDLNILRSLRGDQPKPKKPYSDETDGFLNQRESTMPETAKYRRNQSSADGYAEDVLPLGAKPIGAADSTIDIPFVKESDMPVFSDFLDPERTANPDQSRTQTMTKEDIAKEVKSLIQEKDPAHQGLFDTAESTGSYPIEDSKSRIDAELATRQQLLNETTQMRAQLDDYQENLSDVSDKMKHTNKVLNFVLVILIIAMVAVLVVVIYWILSSKGII